MKILIYTHYNNPNPNYGGIERASWVLADFFLKNKNDVIVLSRIERDCFCDNQILFKQYYLPSLIPSDDVNQQYLYDLIRKEEIGLIINQGGLFEVVKSRKYLNGLKIVSVIHDSPQAIFNSLNSRIAKFRFKISSIYHYTKTLHYSDKVVVFSERLLQELKIFSLYKFYKEDKYRIIPNFNSYSSVLEKPKNKEVLFVGRLVNGTKGVDRLLNIWKQIEIGNSEWILNIIGSGPDEDWLKRLAEDLGLRNVYFRGMCQPDIYYQTASIFCLTSTYESFGLVLTEAMQHSIPCLAFDSYSMASEIIKNQVNGFLIKPFDIQEYSTKLENLITDNVLRSSLGVNAQKSTEKFSMNKVGEKWSDLISEICY